MAKRIAGLAGPACGILAGFANFGAVGAGQNPASAEFIQ
jgi:hypothetical protein